MYSPPPSLPVTHLTSFSQSPSPSFASLGFLRGQARPNGGSDILRTVWAEMRRIRWFCFSAQHLCGDTLEEASPHLAKPTVRRGCRLSSFLLHPSSPSLSFLTHVDLRMIWRRLLRKGGESLPSHRHVPVCTPYVVCLGWQKYQSDRVNMTTDI